MLMVSRTGVVVQGDTSTFLALRPALVYSSNHKRLQGRLMTKNRQSGFTIIELMIATMVFSVLLLVAATTVDRFTKNFQKGLTETNTQNVARSVIDNISQTVQFEGTPNPLASPPDNLSFTGYCIGSTKYSYVLGDQLEDQIPHALIEEQNTGSSC